MKDQPIILDSSCWIEYFLGTDLADHYADKVKSAEVIVPSLCLFEVSRALLKRFQPEHVLTAVSVMQQCEVVALSEGVAVNAAQLAVNLNLSSADAIIYATSLQRKALLYTHDPDLNGLDQVHYIERTIPSKHQRTSA